MNDVQDLPIRCPEGVDLVDAYLDGDLSDAELARFEAHLSGCPVCRDELELAREVAGVFADLPRLECPPEVIERVEVQRRGVGGGASSDGWSWAQAATLLGILAAGLLAGLIFLGDREPPPPTPTMAELQEAEEELRFALAYFGGIARKASLTLRDDVLSDRVLEPPRRALQRLGAPSSSGQATDEKENS